MIPLKYVPHGACYIDESVDVSCHCFGLRKFSSLVNCLSEYFGVHPGNLVCVALKSNLQS